ncbi:hypothetical protein QQ045_032930 [Rhodiola kirilowii]
MQRLVLIYYAFLYSIKGKDDQFSWRRGDWLRLGRFTVILHWSMYIKQDMDEEQCLKNTAAEKGELVCKLEEMERKGVHDGHCKKTLSDSLLPGLNDDVALNCLAWASRSDYNSLACLNWRFNGVIKSGSLSELRRKLGIVDHWVYLIFDLKGWDAFDPTRKKWITLPKIPCDDCFHLADKESLAVGNELLVFGREMLDLVVWKYSLCHASWIKCGRMNVQRCLFGSSSLGYMAIVAGGSDKKGNILKSAEMYDSLTGTWEMLPSMHTPRRLCSGFFMDGKFYVIGGLTTSAVPLTCGEEYDLQARIWRKIEGMYPNVNIAAQAPPLVAVVNNQLYSVEHMTNMVKRYNKQDNTWTVLGRLPVKANSSNGWGLAFKACGDKLIVVGGQRGPEGEAVVLNSWHPDSGVINGALDWKVLGVKEHVGVFVFNCAVMGC